jgi:membrane associated rhomboid family serine protease
LRERIAMLNTWVGRLILANVLMFMAEQYLPAFESLVPFLVLRPVLIPVQPWTLVTYMFLHQNFFHILFNMMALFFFGPRLEAQLTGARFLGLYLVSGIAGGLLSWIFSPFAGIVGASGAVLGIMYGYARYWPKERILLFFVPMEARFAVLGMAALDLYGGIQGGGGVAHFAHLGGVAAAVIYLRLVDRTPRARRFEAISRPPRTSRTDVARWSKIRRDELHSVNREELDRIMEKIEREGTGSVTAQERVFLDNFSERYGAAAEAAPREKQD